MSTATITRTATVTRTATITRTAYVVRDLDGRVVVAFRGSDAQVRAEVDAWTQRPGYTLTVEAE